MRLIHSRQRPGAIVPLVALCLVALLAMVALAIDIGMVAVAKTQAQNAADVAAMAAVRSFTGQTGYNLANAPVNGITAATQNKIFSSYVPGSPGSISNPSADVYTSGAVTIECGGYYYVYNDANPANEAFTMVIPGKLATEPYTAVRATIQTTSPLFFGSVVGSSPFNVKAHAVAAHRPRDSVIIMDLSGSMRFESCPGAYADGTGYAYPHFGPRTVSMNPDAVFPQFGQYSSASAALQGTTNYPSSDVMVDTANISTNTNGGNAVIPYFMSSGSTPAFTPSSSGYNTAPGGDNFLKNGANYAQTVSDIIGATPTPATMVNWCRNGYQGYNGNVAFNGYTEGPNYWGKTFFIWPPDPRGSDLDASNAANHANNGAKDWRQRFFFKQKTSDSSLYWLDNNNILFDPAGSPALTDGSGVTPIIKTPQTTTNITENGASVSYRCLINYAAVFQWLKNSAPTHFPASMTTGRIAFYTSIPDPTGDNNFNTRFWTQNPMTNLSERFWKDYVDYVFGLVQSGANSYSNSDGYNPWASYFGNGDYFSWGTVQVTQKADCNYTATINNSGGYAAGYNGVMTFASVKNLSGTAVDLPGPNGITGVTAATPVKITSANHGLTTGNTINVQGVQGTVGATINSNVLAKTWTVTVVDSNNFSLNGSVGVGTYTANSGAWIPAITAATNASPIVITTGSPHNLPTTNNPASTVVISGVQGNTAANGKWAVNVINSTQFSLTASTGNGAYTNTLATQWWEPVYYVRVGTQNTFYELSPTTIASGTLSGTPDINVTTAIANSTSVKIYTTVPKYMSYTDNPYRPKHHFWFGPMTFVDWLGNYEAYQYPNGTYTLRWPGNVPEAQAWACKIGISAAVDDIQANHPNDFVGLTFFSTPNYNSNGDGQHNQAVVPLGRSYQNMKDSLWFPPTTVSGGVSTITPYDADFQNVPRAKGGTAPEMGFMIAYNLLSSSVTNLRNYPTSATYRGFPGGLGRKGAARMVIFLTDGAPNSRADTSITSAGADSYYPVRLKNPLSLSASGNEFPNSGSYADSDVFAVVKQIAAQSTATPPGYSTTRKPALVYSIGYGSLFDPANKAYLSRQAAALTFLQSVQYYGNVSGNTTGTNFPDNQLIYGTTAQRQTRIQTVFSKIMQAGVQVSLIE